ncbi:MAG: trypsin-like serine peptidase, partial [Bryobacteraceae bacterium]
MSHRLGSVLNVGAPITIGPDTGPPTTPPKIWTGTFPVDPLAKYVILHVNGAALGASDHVEIELGYDTDRYDPSWGPDYWSRPIKGGAPVTIRYVRGGGGGPGSVTIDKYGRGEALIGDGSAQANGDMFLLTSPFDDPTYQYALGKYPPGSAPTWENVACLSPGIMKDTARSVGMYVVVDGDHLSSCTATLIAPDLIITAGHCLATDEETGTGSVTFDFQTNCDGTKPGTYNPKFHKLKRVVRQGYQRAAGDLRPVLDYAVIQIVTPAGGLGLPPIALRPDVPPVNEPLFIIHHPRGATKKVSRYPIDTNCKVMPGSD